MAAASTAAPTTPIMSFMDLIRITDKIDELPQQLQRWGLIPTEGDYKCPTCGNSLRLERFQDSQTFICVELKLSQRTAVDWASFCREVCLEYFMYRPTKLDGPGIVDEVDSKFGRRKYHKRHRIESQWVFGGFERGTGRVFMVPVEQRGTNTLLPIIKQWIKPGTTIISDCWKAYDVLHQEGYEHLKVWHGFARCGPVWLGRARCDSVWVGETRFGLVRFGLGWWDLVGVGMARLWSVWPGWGWCVPVWGGVTRLGSVWPGLGWCGPV
ncbi:ISXO2-like transposase domain [Popillia japonica]|uniref:ISXO2-like transposase domain n=1 Tax=Popillia japonica TaxID=7064 RepID=A0AAW1IDF1_POPJA